MTNKLQISSLISTKKSHTLNNSLAQLVNNKKLLFAQAQSEIQLSFSSSFNLIENSTISKTNELTSPRNFPVGKVFNRRLIASLTSKDALLKEVRDCIIRSHEERLQALNTYLHSYWWDLHVSSGCVRMDEKVGIPNTLKDALIEDLHASHPGSWGIICMAQHCWWPYMNSYLLVQAIECKPCTAIVKNLKSTILAKQFQAHKTSLVANQEIQIDFVGPIIMRKIMKLRF